ncbi:MAG: hypothetical protein CVV49_08910 [Spirochaetae bacterium HGW-Spirochaetae-5]|nr:MAG: hypothetical protein CVV49_08910 [Spirochaetae bacterium HGW-Spirochaetae-5]
MPGELRYPNVKDESEDPALVMARNSLKRKTPEPKVKAKKGVKTCWRCKEPVGKENLTQKWIRRLNAQRFLCDTCIPLKDEATPWTENEEYRPSPVKEKVTVVTESDSEIKSLKPGPIYTIKKNRSDLIKVKECFKCDCTLFFVMKGSIVKCSQCESEYNL